LQDWIGVRLGVPVYINPVAVSIAIGAPAQVRAHRQARDRAGLDDFLNIKVKRFAPSFYQELQNAVNANGQMTNTKTLERRDPGLVLRRVPVSAERRVHRQARACRAENFDTGKKDGCKDTKGNASECLTTFHSRRGSTSRRRKFVDLGLSLGFDDLAHIGSFSPAGFVAFRI